MALIRLKQLSILICAVACYGSARRCSAPGDQAPMIGGGADHMTVALPRTSLSRVGQGSVHQALGKRSVKQVPPRVLGLALTLPP